MPELIQVGKKAVEGVVFTGHFHAKAASTPTAKRYLKLYKAKYNKDGSSLDALGADAYLILLKAIEDAGSLNSDKIRDAMARIKGFEGVTGVITMGKGGNPVKSAVLIQVKDGKFQFLDIVNPQ